MATATMSRDPAPVRLELVLTYEEAYELKAWCQNRPDGVAKDEPLAVVLGVIFEALQPLTK